MATNHAQFKPARVFHSVSGELFAAILEQRMAAHKRWQHQAEVQLMAELIDEIQALPARAPKSARLFELLPEHVQGNIVVNSLEMKQ